MRFRDLKIQSKLIGSFSAIAIFFILSGIFELIGINQLNDSSSEARHLQKIATEMNEREIAHLKWAQTALLDILDETKIRTDVNVDERTCLMGKMLYSDVRKDLENSVPATKPLLAEIETPHTNLHKSAIKINSILAQGGADVHKSAIEYFISNSVYELEKIAEISHQIEDEIYKVVDLKIEEEKSMSSTYTVFIILAILINGIFSITMGILISRSITKPLLQGVELAQHIENGDLTHSLHLERNDELGVLSSALDNMTDFLRNLASGISTTAVSLSDSATNFNTISGDLSNNSNNLTEKTNTVSSATEEINRTMSSISAAAEQSATNIDVIASSTEEMTATVQEISRNTGKAQQISSEAVKAVENALGNVSGLGASAKDVGNVVEVILEIADQTKLLALNATIEAARAGEAGKGFAVVASEVKELAAQTNSAIDEIQQKIESIQENSNSTILEIQNIDKVINEVDEIVSSIATAVEEQSVTTKDIAENIVQAADGIKEMTQNVTQAASATSLIAQDTNEVSMASSDVNGASHNVSNEVNNLSQMSVGLKELVEKLNL